jgi:hypothetical protein
LQFLAWNWPWRTLPANFAASEMQGGSAPQHNPTQTRAPCRWRASRRGANLSRGEDAGTDARPEWLTESFLFPHANLEPREMAPNVAPDQKG